MINYPPPSNISHQPASWESLRFSPVGLNDLRHRLGCINKEPGVFERFRNRFEAADLAWFAAGLAATPNQIQANAFSNQFLQLRDDTAGSSGGTLRRDLQKQVRQLTFDMVSRHLFL